jgi:hypothetical protein
MAFKWEEGEMGKENEFILLLCKEKVVEKGTWDLK